MTALLETRVAQLRDECPADECWTWRWTLNPKGYAQQGSVKIHRWSYENYVGAIPDGLHIDHLCRNRACVNPSHLEPVTARTNFLRGESAGATAVRTNRCKRDHELSPDNVYAWRGARYCKACNRIRYAAWKARKAS